jgi:hypothetical protein
LAIFSFITSAENAGGFRFRNAREKIMIAATVRDISKDFLFMVAELLYLKELNSTF